MSNVTTITPPHMASGGRVAAIVPQSMEEAYRLAKAVCMAGMAPKGLDTPEKAMIAIMQGMEVGLTPMASLQRIAVVNGRPTIWGDGAMSLVRGSGICEFVRETIVGDGDGRYALCAVKRRGEPDEVSRRFSVADAKKAGLWGKAGPWTQYPERMLQMRARAFALRDVFADVLGGMYLREEIEDATNDRRTVAPPSPPPARLNPPSPASPPAIEHHRDNSQDEPFDATAFFEALEVGMAGAKTADDVEDIWSEFDPGGTFDGDDTNLSIAAAIKKRRLSAIAKDAGNA